MVPIKEMNGMNEKEVSKKRPAIFLILSVIIGIALTPQFNIYGQDTAMLSTENEFMYEKAIHVLAMLLVGFGFLMMFVKKYGYTSITATYLVIALSIPLYVLIRPFLWGSASEVSVTNVSMLIYAEFAAASLLIAIGGPLGRIDTAQYLLIGAVFTPLYAMNEWILFSGNVIPSGMFLDTAGSVMIHAFGAYFSLGLIRMLTSQKDRAIVVETSETSNKLAMLGSGVLWIFWPSFCSALVTMDKIPIVAINTVLALCGATLSTYAFSIFIRGRIEIGDIANASLAGGVAIGATVANIAPGWAMILGLVAGSISVIGYAIIQPRIQKATGGVDTCGVHNLHGMPGVFGGLFALGFVTSPLWQLLGIILSVIFAISMGVVVGFISDHLGQKEVSYEDTAEFGTGIPHAPRE